MYFLQILASTGAHQNNAEFLSDIKLLMKCEPLLLETLLIFFSYSCSYKGSY